jgi:hypothetical protein
LPFRNVTFARRPEGQGASTTAFPAVIPAVTTIIAAILATVMTSVDSVGHHGSRADHGRRPRHWGTDHASTSRASRT